MEDNSTPCKKTPTWQNCVHCPSLVFSTTIVRLRNSKGISRTNTILKKVQSYSVNWYGPNGICSALQFGDLGKAGFKYHVREYHLYEHDCSNDWNIYSSSQNLPEVLNDPNRVLESKPKLEEMPGLKKTLQETQDLPGTFY